MRPDYADLSYLHLDGSLTQAAGAAGNDELEAAANSQVLQAGEIKSPVVIESIELLLNNGLYFVRSRSKDGSEGVAVASERAEYLHPLLKRLIIPYFIGKDARDLEKLLDGVYVHESNYKLAGLALWCCISWVEASLLDMLGRIAGKPVGELLGGVIRSEVPFYVASGNRGTTPEEEIEVLQRKLEETGAKAIKFKVGGRMSKNADSIAGRSEGLIYLTRRAFGDGMAIHADGNGSYDPPEAVRYGKMLEEIGAFFYEEPCPFDHLEETKEVADALTIPLAFGEQETSMRRFKWIVANGAAQVLQPDLQYNGGFIRTTRVARMAALKGMAVTPHLSSGFGYVYVLHFASYIPNIGKYQECKTGVRDTGYLLAPPMEVKDGFMKAPSGPGLGLDAAEVNRVLRKACAI
ncbi:mandelate racemase/muconate lactonizing enzyme family protein [Paenibacillus humicola]|uniref:mandelate racemase/muconate lactonizing enzyme family protein n=1 Tax=Paenibacillus humicola TaxID=3110540 RepID=UPI00237A7743|nr:mandelate racemase/muconate lactonizing enzyme family protein [Paenibacillus humicola]